MWTERVNIWETLSGNDDLYFGRYNLCKDLLVQFSDLEYDVYETKGFYYAPLSAVQKNSFLQKIDLIMEIRERNYFTFDSYCPYLFAENIIVDDNWKFCSIFHLFFEINIAIGCFEQERAVLYQSDEERDILIQIAVCYSKRYGKPLEDIVELLKKFILNKAPLKNSYIVNSYRPDEPKTYEYIVNVVIERKTYLTLSQECIDLLMKNMDSYVDSALKNISDLRLSYEDMLEVKMPSGERFAYYDEATKPRYSIISEIWKLYSILAGLHSGQKQPVRYVTSSVLEEIHIVAKIFADKGKIAESHVLAQLIDKNFITFKPTGMFTKPACAAL